MLDILIEIFATKFPELVMPDKFALYFSIAIGVEEKNSLVLGKEQKFT